MSPIYIILYAVIVTLLLTIFFPRIRKPNPSLLWLLIIAGLSVLLIVIVFSFTS